MFLPLSSSAGEGPGEGLAKVPGRGSLPLFVAFFLFLLAFPHAVALGQPAPTASSNPDDPPDDAQLDRESVSRATDTAFETDATNRSTDENAFSSRSEEANNSASRDQLIRYLVAGGLMLGGIVLAVPPLYYLALGKTGCEPKDQVEQRGCKSGYRPMRWYDYAGLALGGALVGVGVAVIVWPEPETSGQTTALVFSGTF